MAGRNTTCTIICGAQRTGKTTFAKKLADGYEKKVLVVCPDDMEQAWFKYRMIQLQDLNDFDKGKARIIYDPRDKNWLTTIIDNYKNGMLIWDDAKAYFNNNARIFELETMLLRRRQFNLDIMFMYHGFSTIPPLLWTYTTHLALFKTNDAFQRAAAKTFSFEKLSSAMAVVNNQARIDPHYHEIIPLV